jgi:phosphocarrier protein HPr
MIERTATIASKVGLHARPASIIAEAAAEYEPLEITIAAETEPAEEAQDASSMLSLMSLGASYGDTVVLRAEGAGAEAALDHLVQLLETDLDAK